MVNIDETARSFNQLIKHGKSDHHFLEYIFMIDTKYMPMAVVFVQISLAISIGYV